MDGSSLLLKTGKAGRTALHVAAIQGSFELLSTIHNFFPSATYNSSLASLLNEAIDGRSEMNAYVIARYINGCRYDFWIDEKTRCKPDAYSAPELRLLDSENLTPERRRKYHDNASSMVKIITDVWQDGTAEGRYEGLIESFEQNVDYNFCSSKIYAKLFLFHHACSRVDGQEFVEDVIEHCAALGEERVNELMQLLDFQLRTPLHVALAVAPAEGRDAVLDNIIESLRDTDVSLRDSTAMSKFVSMRDGKGWTPLHMAATLPYSATVGALIEFSDVTARISPKYGEVAAGIEACTALHLAVLHSNRDFVSEILVGSRCQHASLDCLRLKREINCGFSFHTLKDWTTLSLVLLLGNEDLVERFLSWTAGYAKGEVRIVL